VGVTEGGVEKNVAEKDREEPDFFDAEETARKVTVKVSTEVMDITLRSMGGEIGSVKLFNYRTHMGEPVELIPEGKRGGVAVELKKGETTETFADANFSVTVDGARLDTDRRIDLGEGKEKVEILFRKEVGKGDYLEKRFVFFREGYEYSFSFKINREGSVKEADRYAVAWNCGLEVTEENEKGDKQGFASLGKVGEEFYKEGLGHFKDRRSQEQSGQVLWAGARTKYFLSTLIEDNPSSATLELRGNEEDSRVGYAITYPFRGDPRKVEHSYRGYIGP
jgi:YidC/Oxa1 family membrane protein insertase